MVRTERVAALAAFCGLVVVANWLTARYGLVPVGFGQVVTAGTVAAGLVLLARDWVHEAAGRAWVLVCIAVGAGLSALLTTPRLAVASGVAFAVSELADFAVYAPLRQRGWARAAIASNVVGAVVDSLLFLALAGFPVWPGVATQTVVKVAASSVVVVAVMAGAVLRYRVRTEGA